MLINIDSKVPRRAMSQLEALPAIMFVKQIEF